MKKMSKSLLLSLLFLGGINCGALNSFAIGSSARAYDEQYAEKDIFVNNNDEEDEYMEEEDYEPEDNAQYNEQNNEGHSDETKSERTNNEDTTNVTAENEKTNSVVYTPSEKETKKNVHAPKTISKSEKTKKEKLTEGHGETRLVTDKQTKEEDEETESTSEDTSVSLNNPSFLKSMVSSKEQIVELVTYFAALDCAKSAADFLQKGKEFSLPHNTYYDLTMLPTFENVKKLTTTLCTVLNIEVPSEDELMDNYINAMKKILVFNKHLTPVLEELYDAKQNSSSAEDIDFSKLNFENRLMISASSKAKENGEMVMGCDPSLFQMSKEVESLSNDLLGTKITTDLKKKSTDDENAYHMLQVINDQKNSRA